MAELLPLLTSATSYSACSSIQNVLQFEKDELLAKATKEKEEERDEKKERWKEKIEQERLERKTHLNAWKVCIQLLCTKEQMTKFTSAKFKQFFFCQSYIILHLP